MDYAHSKQRFTFLAEAFHGVGGFAPQVLWESQAVTTKTADGTPIQAIRRVPKLAAPCHLVPHPRESPERFAARAAVAVYENHLREACERFVGFLGRRRPVRDGVDAPLVQLLLADADMRGNGLDVFWQSFALHAKARGSMLLLLDLPASDPEEGPVSLQDQLERRAVPYLRAICPEQVRDVDIDDETGAVEWLELDCTEDVGGKEVACVRRWDAQTWSIWHKDELIAQGEHGFGQCPVIPFTESGDCYPHVGKYAQIADMSRGVFNNRSRLDEILGGQTFSVLTLHVPPESSAVYNVSGAVADIGISSILTHPGDRPAFISPDQGNAETYLRVVDQLQAAIKRVSMDDSTASGTSGAESGVARRLRFERLNSDLASFAHRMQQVEARMWEMFHRQLGTDNRVKIEWPSDFNLVDTAAEIDILISMQAAGFPAAVLQAKRLTVAMAEFDSADPDVQAAVRAAIGEQVQENVT